MTDLRWLPIDNTMPDDDYVWVRFAGGGELICDMGDGDPEYWRSIGAVGWTRATDAEMDDFFEQDYITT